MSCYITLNNIYGTPPYSVEICDYYFNTCVFVAYFLEPVTNQVIIVPPPYDNGSLIQIKITDGTGCVLTQETTLFSPTPTQTQTPTPTVTPTQQSPTPTPTNTPTPQSPTPTPTNTPTPQSPTPTPTNSLTPTFTPTKTKTPTPTATVTPTSSPLPATKAFLFIEPQTGATNIGQWMYDQGTNFFGFTNSSQPTQSQVDFNIEMNTYVDFSGWTSGLFPSIINQDVPQTSGGNDSYGNPITAYNFKTTKVNANTTPSGFSWYTWLIPTGRTNGLYQTQIGYSTTGPTILTIVNTEPTIYSYYLNYTGNTIPKTVYRVYTTFPDSNFNLLNNVDIYFKGNTVGT